MPKQNESQDVMVSPQETKTTPSTEQPPALGHMDIAFIMHPDGQVTQYVGKGLLPKQLTKVQLVFMGANIRMATDREFGESCADWFVKTLEANNAKEKSDGGRVPERPENDGGDVVPESGGEV